MGSDTFNSEITIPEGWSCKKLTDCIEDGVLSYGIVQPGAHVENGVPIIRVNNFNNGVLELGSFLKVDESIAENYKRTKLEGGEVLLTLVGSTGQVAIAPTEIKGWNVARAIAVIRPKEEIGAEWLSICLQSKESQLFLDARANTTVQKTLNLKDVKELPIIIPPNPLKKSIEFFTTALNRKIELNRQMNATLEAMAQALFKSWFVDFDPVMDNALAAGNPIPDELQAKAAARLALGEARKALTPEIQALFPNAFVLNEEMGWIPEGWEVSTLGNEFSVEMGQSPPSTTYNQVGDGIPFFQGSTDFGFRYPENRVYCTEPKKFAKSGDTLISVRAPVGDTNIAKFDCCIGRGLSAVMHKSKSKSYTYYAINNMKTYFSSFESEGTVFGSINQKSLKNLPVLSFSKAIMEIFDIYVKALDKKIEVNSNQIENLTNLRDTLLPKLLSGELRIPEAEQLAADALN